MDSEELRIRELEDEVERLRGVILQAADDVRTAPREVVALTLRRAVLDERKGYRWTAEEVLDAIRAWEAEHGEPPTSSMWSPGHLRNKGQEEEVERFLAGHYPVAPTVVRFFGSFPQAVVAAGFEPAKIGRPKGVQAEPSTDPRWPEWRGWEYLRAYRTRSGISMKDLSAQTHISYGHLRHMEQGLKTNPGIRVILALSQGLQVRPAALLEDIGSQAAWTPPPR